MKCQKCGAALVTGHLYCDVCGAEYQIVPDFEPELEISMAQTLRGVGKSLQQEIKDIPAQNRKKTAGAVPKWGLVFLLVFILAAAIGIWSYVHSVRYMEKRALKARTQEEYLTAADWYGKLKLKQPAEEKWYLEEAWMYLQQGKTEEAMALGMQALESDMETEAVYRFLLELCLQQEEYQQVNDLLGLCRMESLRQEYADYLAPQPQANYSSGCYDTILELTLSGPDQGNIYYSLDGSPPDTHGIPYREPIVMGNGEYDLQALYINPYGVVSTALQLAIEIEAAAPLAPMVEPESGTYEQAGEIRVSIEEETEVFYTTDGTMPNRNSIPYKEPVPMPLGESHFTFIAYRGEELSGEITRRDYLLNIKTGITPEEAGDLLVQKMIQKGHILDKNGALTGYYGVHRYFYAYPLLLGDKHYYVFAEHYLENEINQKTGQLYAVDVIEGNCRRLLKEEAGGYSLEEI